MITKISGVTTLSALKISNHYNIVYKLIFKTVKRVIYFLLLIFKCSLYILDTNLLLDR